MADPHMLIRIAANLAELKKNLAEGKISIETTTSAMTKLASSLDGSKLEQRAHNIVAAINQVGGATKLTDAEAQRHLKTLDAWIQKADRMGKEIPPAMLATRDSLKQIDDASQKGGRSTDDWVGKLKGFAAAAGLAFSVQAVKSFIQSTLAAAGQIDDASQKLGVSAEAFQRWKFAAEQGGATGEHVEKAVNLMNRALAEGDKSTVNALKSAGLSFDAIRQMRPEDAFNTITKAIGDIQDPMERARVAMELFGRGGAELLPALMSDFAAVAAGAKVMSDETVKRLADAEDAWARMGTIATVMSGEVLSTILKDVERASTGWKGFFATLAQYGPGRGFAVPLVNISDGAGGGAKGDNKAAEDARLKAIRDSIESARRAAEEAAARVTATRANEEYTETLKRMAAARIPLTQAQIAQIDLWAKEHQSVGDMAKALRVSEVQVSSYIKANQEFEKNLKTASTVVDGLKGSLRDYGTQVDISQRQTTLMYESIRVRDGLPSLPGLRAAINELPPAIQAASKELDRLKLVAENMLASLSNAFMNLASVTTGTVSQIAAGFGNIVNAIENGKQAANTFKDGLALMNSGKALAGIAGMATGIMGIVTAAIAAGKAIAGIWNALDRNKGRDAVVDFADSFGGFDALHKKLGELGEEGERLWIALTQGVGRNNPEQAARIIDEITAKFAKQDAAREAATVSTEAGAQATIETATQAALALDELNARLLVNADGWSAWSKTVTGVLNDLANAIRSLPLPTAPGMSAGAGGGSAGAGGRPAYGGAQAHGGDYWVTKPTMFLAGEAGPERATFTPAGRGGGGGGKTIIQTVVKLERRVLAEAMAEEYL